MLECVNSEFFKGASLLFAFKIFRILKLPVQTSQNMRSLKFLKNFALLKN